MPRLYAEFHSNESKWWSGAAAHNRAGKQYPGTGLADRVQNVSIGDTHILSPQMISSFRINFLRTATQRLGNPNVPNLCSLGMTNATCPTPHIFSSLYSEPGNQGWDYENAFGLSE